MQNKKNKLSVIYRKSTIKHGVVKNNESGKIKDAKIRRSVSLPSKG